MQSRERRFSLFRIFLHDNIAPLSRFKGLAISKSASLTQVFAATDCARIASRGRAFIAIIVLLIGALTLLYVFNVRLGWVW